MNYDCATGFCGMSSRPTILKPSALSPEYRTPDSQLQLAAGGFGCQPNARGRAVFCERLYSGLKSRYEKQDILGVADINRLPEWARQKITQVKNIHNRTVIHT